jgi:hypothetical protein
MKLYITIDFSSYEMVQQLVSEMMKSDWMWEFSVYPYDSEAQVTISNITCYESMDALQIIIKKVLKEM